MIVTIIIIAITVLASMHAWKNPGVLNRWLFNPYKVVTNNQYDRFITSGFIHNDQAHLIFNMFTFFFFGAKVEQYLVAYFGSLGMGLFVLLYLVSIVVADLPTFIKYKDKPYYNSLGASGGVSAIVFSAIAFDPVSKIYLYFIMGISGFLLGILYLIYSYHQSKKPGADNINHDAHFYGAIFGFIATMLIIPNSFSTFWQQMLTMNLRDLIEFGI